MEDIYGFLREHALSRTIRRKLVWESLSVSANE